MLQESFYFHAAESPIAAAAIHSGHEVRTELKPLFNLSETERLREEDPYTDWLTSVAPSRIIVNRSRFEVDLNRERDLAVYRTPEDAWGLKVWKEPLDEDVINRCLALYDKFYEEVKKFLTSIVDKYGYVVIYDLHTYNHQREGIEAPPADPVSNPDVNLGTANLNRDLWGPVVDGLASDHLIFPGDSWTSVRMYDLEGDTLHAGSAMSSTTEAVQSQSNLKKSSWMNGPTIMINKNLQRSEMPCSSRCGIRLTEAGTLQNNP